MMQLTIDEAISARDRGIRKALEHACCVNQSWAHLAMEALSFYLMNASGPFMAEDVREYAYLHGLPDAPSHRAWGGIFQSASKKKLIRQVGFAFTKNVKAHRTPAALWEKV